MRGIIWALVLAAAALTPGLQADVPSSPPAVEDGYLKLGFDRLSAFKYVAPTDPVADGATPPASDNGQIPASVKAWNGKKAMITGFMLPTKLENGKAVEFLIMANQMACCYGTVPNMNDWVVVRMPAGVPVVQDVPISFYGVLKVGAMYQNGYLTGIYEMDADREGEIKD